MRESSKVTRRGFLGGLVATGALVSPHIVPASALGLGRGVAPSDRITLGFIGVGGHGVNRNLVRCLKETDAQAVAVCDVDSARCQAAKKRVEAHYAETAVKGKYTGCAAYKDFRDIIVRDDIDAVVVSTPDHWHVLPSVMAARAVSRVPAASVTVK